MIDITTALRFKSVLRFMPYIVILILLIASGIMGVKLYNLKPEIIIRDSIVTQHDSVDRIVTVYAPKPKPDTIIDRVILNQKVDTAKILADYNKVREYNLPLIFDSLNYANVHASVYQNELQAYDYTPYFKPITTTIYKDKVATHISTTKWFIGGGIGGWNNKFDIALKVSVLNKKNQLYSVKYNLIQPEIWISGSLMLSF